MLKWWGWVGIVLIALCELNFIYKIQPFALWYFPLIWLGFILFIDSLSFRVNGKSLISSNLPKLIGMFVISPVVWWLFEFFNLIINNWHYIGTEPLGRYYNLFGVLSFSTVIPAFFEIFDLFKGLFRAKEKNNLKKISKPTIQKIISLGIILLIAILIFPKFFFWATWLSLFLILDPINYLRKQPSLINQFANKNFKLFLAAIIAILVMGFCWEFWNYYAVIKWIYTVPFFDFFHIFEMPILGYLGYIPFALELYSIYYFVKGCFS